MCTTTAFQRSMLTGLSSSTEIPKLKSKCLPTLVLSFAIILPTNVGSTGPSPLAYGERMVTPCCQSMADECKAEGRREKTPATTS